MSNNEPMSDENEASEIVHNASAWYFTEEYMADQAREIEQLKAEIAKRDELVEQLQQQADTDEAEWIASNERLRDEMARLEEGIVEQQTEIAAMRPIVEAVAACADNRYVVCVVCGFGCDDHGENCPAEHARAYVEQHPTTAVQIGVETTTGSAPELSPRMRKMLQIGGFYDEDGKWHSLFPGEE